MENATLYPPYGVLRFLLDGNFNIYRVGVYCIYSLNLIMRLPYNVARVMALV